MECPLKEKKNVAQKKKHANWWKRKDEKGLNNNYGQMMIFKRKKGKN